MRDKAVAAAKTKYQSNFKSFQKNYRRAQQFEARAILLNWPDAQKPKVEDLIPVLDDLARLNDWPQAQGAAPLQPGPPQPAHRGPPVATGAFATIPQDLALTIFNRLSSKDLMVLRWVSRTNRALAERLLLGRIGVRAAHSLTSDLQAMLTQTIDRAASVRISVDKLTDARLVNDIFGGKATMRTKLKALNAGTETDALARLPNGKATLVPKHGGERMHTKFFLIGGDTVISGSPNLSHAAMESNSECVIVIESPWIGLLFREYFEQIAHYARTPDLNAKSASRQLEAVAPGFAKRLSDFNAVSPVRVALAPFANIGDFFCTELSRANGADIDGVRIVVRQFLVSEGGRNIPDVINCLIELQNAKADVTVVVDYDSYYADGTWFFVQPAMKKLAASGVTCLLQQRDFGASTGLMHDKLILIEYRRKGVVTKTALVGSAGITRNVLNNENWEVMIAVDEDEVYESFMAAHTLSLAPDQGVYTHKL